MANVAGQRTTQNVASSQRVIDLRKQILLLDPSETPFTVISQQTKGGSLRAAATDTTYSWHNDELVTRFDAVNNAGNITSSDTTIEVDTGSLFHGEDIVLNPRTGEQIRVVSEASNIITVERGWGATTGTAMNDDDPLLIIGSAAVEGETSKSSVTQNPAKVSNYTQIFRSPVEASGTWLTASNESSPHDWPYQHKKKAIEHLIDIELSGLFGTPSDGAQRTTGGLLNFLTSNNQAAGGTLTEAELETFVRTIAGPRGGNANLTLFAAPLVVSVINDFAVGRLHVQQGNAGNSTYGLNVMEYVSAFGTVKLVSHPLLTGAVYGGYAIAVDFKTDGTVRYRYLDGDGPGPSRDTKLLTNRQENDRDGLKDEWLTEAGWEVGLPKRHGVLTGVTG